MKRIQKGKRRWAGILFILPSLLGVGIFLWIPFLDVVRRAFVTAIDGRWVGLHNFRTVIANKAFRLAVLNTVRFTVVCIPLLILLAFLIALCLQRWGRFGKGLKSAFLVPMAIPVASVVLMWKLVFHKNGFLNGFLHLFGVNGPDWMNTDAAFWVLVFSYLWKNLGYDVVLWMAGLSGISPSLYEAARVDGAGEWQCFVHITLPCLKPALYTISVLSFLNSFKVFREAYLVAGDYPQESMYLLQHLFNNWYRSLDLDKMAAGAVLTAIFVLGLILLLQKAWEGGEEI